MPAPKNFIQRLQAENAALKACIDGIADNILQFRMHLCSPKFQGTEPDGSRRDWIATSDVEARLRVILDEVSDDLHEIEPLK